ncbi:MAG: hypothetical protein Q4G33_14370 [bacterium]|nr:hypothetical protein [bacterium]
MGKFFNTVAIAAIGTALITIRKKSKEKQKEERRKNMRCEFVDGFSQEEFNDAALAAGKRIKRLYDLHTDGPYVYGSVRSQSGLSTWQFMIDFNDYGHVTGRYWVFSDNYDSVIPKVVAERIKSSIESI